MDYTTTRVRELAVGIPWHPHEVLRAFWVRLSDQSRQDFATQIRGELTPGEWVVPLIIREHSFYNANSLLSDTVRLFTANRTEIEGLKSSQPTRITALLLGKEEFRLPQTSSPIELPAWFPILGGVETSFRISDLGRQAEVNLLSCEEIRIRQLSELVFELERSIVQRLEAVASQDAARATEFIAKLLGTAASATDGAALLTGYRQHVDSVPTSREYRPQAGTVASLLSKVVKLTHRSSPKDLARDVSTFASAIGDTSAHTLNPSLFAVFLRPTIPLSPAEKNWQYIFLGLYQAYQLMNGYHHAGDYGSYPISLLYSTSIDLRRFLQDARLYVDDLTL